jgi:hypothetical protein
MKLFLDCEYNEFRNELVSMALVSEDGTHEWCVDRYGSVSVEETQNSLQAFISQFDSIHLITDWAEDIRFFSKVLNNVVPSMTMEIFVCVYDDHMQYNALHYANAMRRNYLMCSFILGDATPSVKFDRNCL